MRAQTTPTLFIMMFKMSAGEFDLVYNSLSFTLASMMASTDWGHGGIRVGSERV